MQLGARHWLIALASAVAVHLSLLTFFERPAEPVAPGQGILIELGDRGDAGDGAPEPEAQSPLHAEDLPEAEPVALQTMESEAVAEVQTEELDLTEPEPSPDPVALAEPVPVPEPVIAKPRTEVRPKAKPKKPKKTRSAKRKKKAAKTQRNKKIAKDRPRKAAGSGGKGKVRKGSGKQGAGTASGASPAAAQSRYAGQISAWLNRNKRYPKRARRLEQQGSVTVRFTVARDGSVLSSDIVRSSGYAALDDEVRALMRRGRMPRMPAVMTQARMTISVPIRFRLQ